MRGRILHDLEGKQSFVPYGQRPHEVIFSVSRPGLNGVLLDHAQRVYGVSPSFCTPRAQSISTATSSSC
jgi:kynurenine 3-monooxygenase